MRTPFRCGLVVCALVLLGVCVIDRTAHAIPINGQYTNDPTMCDHPLDQHLTHEIGETVGFPIDERIEVVVMPGPLICVADDGIANDFEVEITNLSATPWVNLFFVADTSHSVGNKDGFVFDLAGGIGALPGEAFRIDGTVTVTGLNDNLIFESGAIDEVFSPGETWRFLVTNFVAPMPPTFDSPGMFASTSIGFPPSTASILAVPIPEPSSFGLLALGVAGIWGYAYRRRRRAA